MNLTVSMQLLLSAEKNRERNALWVDQQFYTYEKLFQDAETLAVILRYLTLQHNDPIKNCAIYADRNYSLYRSILAAMLTGHLFMPMNTHDNVARNQRRFKISKSTIICVDSKNLALISQFLQGIDPTHVILFDGSVLAHLRVTVPQHYYYYCDAEGKKFPRQRQLSSIQPHDLAYLLFTSGSTGQPKGIAVKQSALSAFLRGFLARVHSTEGDKFLQACEVTFNLAIHDIFVSWSVGATLYILPENAILHMANFIKKHAITHCSLVPSTITLLTQLGKLPPHIFPEMRYTFICGEPFLQSQALAWQCAAPHSVIDNLYGPAEATVVCFAQKWRREESSEQPPVVPIGKPLLGQSYVVIDKNNKAIQTGTGELCLAGPQVIDCYWADPAQTAKYFKYFDWDPLQRRWYCTGDLVTFDPRYGLLYSGRLDDQWQIRGYRVEKVEIENELRRLARNEALAVVPIENGQQIVEGIVVYTSANLDEVTLIAKARQELPSTMIPKKIIYLAELPKNASGKIDYVRLKQMSREQQS